MLNYLMPLMLVVENARTGDNRNIVLWIVVGVIALLLIIACSVMSVISKKKEDGKQDDTEDQSKNS